MRKAALLGHVLHLLAASSRFTWQWSAHQTCRLANKRAKTLRAYPALSGRTDAPEFRPDPYTTASGRHTETRNIQELAERLALAKRGRSKHASQGPATTPTHADDETPHKSSTSTLCGKLACPLPGRLFIATAVGLVHLCNVGHEWVIRVGVRQQGADG